MNEFNAASDIAALLAQRLRCQACGRRFRPQDFSLVEAIPQWNVFALRCAMCLSQRLVIGAHVKGAIRAYATELDAAEWKRYRRSPRIDTDDVVRIARMLKTYTDDFSDVLEDPLLDEADS